MLFGGEWDISATELAERLKQGDPIRLLDVREPHELQISHMEGATLIPYGQLAARLSELNSAEEIVVFCKSGNRSAYALELLASAGFRKIKHLDGGINAWAEGSRPKSAGLLTKVIFVRYALMVELEQFKSRLRNYGEHFSIYPLLSKR